MDGTMCLRHAEYAMSRPARAMAVSRKARDSSAPRLRTISAAAVAVATHTPNRPVAIGRLRFFGSSRSRRRH